MPGRAVIGEPLPGLFHAQPSVGKQAGRTLANARAHFALCVEVVVVEAKAAARVDRAQQVALHDVAAVVLGPDDGSALAIAKARACIHLAVVGVLLRLEYTAIVVDCAWCGLVGLG